MKRILSIILAAAMVLSLVPAVFAADTATEGDDALATVTYGFYAGGRSDVADTWLERITYTKADSFDGITDFALLRNAKLMSFPESSDNPNDQWAFVGSGIGRTSSYAKPENGYGVTVGLASDADGKGYISTYMVDTAGSWIAFKIKVPKTATYEISGITAFSYKNASNNIGMYVAPVTEELAATVAAAVDTGTFSVTTTSDGSTVHRKDFTPFADLGISADSLMGKVDIRDTSGNYYSAVKEATDKKAQLLETDKEYYLFLQADSRAMTLRSITLTEVEDDSDEEEIPVARNQEYVFNAYVTTGNGYNTTLYDDFSEINETAGTDDWAISAYGAHSTGAPAYTQLSSTILKFYANKTGYGADSDISNKAVIALDVEAEGTYDISVTTNAIDYGAEADVYILSEKELTETYASYLNEGKVTTALFRELPIQGRISSIGASGEIVNNIGAKKLSGGTNYMIFHIVSDNPKTLKMGNNNQCIDLIKINLDLTDSVAEEESAAAITGKVSFASGADITLNGEAYSANTVASIDAGSTVTVKADETAGNFAGWIRGRIDSGVYVSTDVEYTFEIMSNTYLTPVYSKEPSADGQMVEFWNANGSYVGSSEVADGSAVAPEASLAGHSFASWLVSANTALDLTDGVVDVSGISDAIIRAVASFVTRESVGANAPENATYLEKNNYYTSIKNDESYTTTQKNAAEAETTNLSLDRVLVNGVEQTKDYGDKIVCTDTGAVTAWLRDGKIVSYDPEYTYYIWDATNIYSTYAKNIEKKPLVVIDDDSIDGAYMIEYDKGNADEVVEAGILFGSKGIVISSTDGSKAASQKNTSHGQFCASPNGDEQYAKGYLIYRVGETLYVIYTDAVAVN